MKILLVMDPGILVPPIGYGGIERIVGMLAKEYLRLGHEVHLLVTKGSFVEGCVMHPFGSEGFPPKKKDALKAIPIAWKFLWQHRNEYDLVHNFGRLAYLLPILNHPVKKIMSYQREISTRNIKWINRLPHKNIVFTGCSRDLLSRGAVIAGKWKAVYNAVDFSKYISTTGLPGDAPLIFLGRIEKVKGCHTAIGVAKATNNNLIIAGNISPLPDEEKYFKAHIEPFIDGKQIQYIGTVNDMEKNEWLGKSKALLFPIEWNEPFGIVVIEAMACGTPVIAFRRGAMMEIVKEGVTGSTVTNIEQMEAAVSAIGLISREECSNSARLEFDIKIIAKEYLTLFDGSSNK
ncbi:MAG: glycosyltransferase [Ferruginibacter sp.]